MTDRAGFLAGLSESLTALCLWWVAAASLIMRSRGGTVGLLLPLGLTLAFLVLFRLILTKPRPVPVLTALVLAAAGAALAALILAAPGKLTLLHLLVLAAGAGMAAGLPLFTCLRRPELRRHLTWMDLLLMALLLRFVAAGDGGIAGADGLMAAVLLLDAGSAVGLRMSAGGDDRDVPRAMGAALLAALVLAGVVLALVALFSRSGALTDSLLTGLGGFFRSLGGAVTRFFQALAGKMKREEQFEALPVEQLPDLSDAAAQTGHTGAAAGGLGAAIVILALVAVAAVLLLVLLRKKRAGLDRSQASAAPEALLTRTPGALGRRWQALLDRLRYRALCRRCRGTPAGTLAWLERRAKRRKCPRRTDESIRGFLTRLAPAGALSPLAEALERACYASGASALSPAQCHALRRAGGRAIRKMPVRTKQDRQKGGRET